MADCTEQNEQTASAANEAENTGADHNSRGESSNTILYPVDRLVTNNNTAGLPHSTDSDIGECADSSNVVLRCQFCKRHVQCIDDKITTLQIYGDSSQPDHSNHSIQALNCSRCNHKTIGVKLCNRWWQLDEALKSSAQRHDGFHQVTTCGERILLFLLNSVIYPQQDYEEGYDIPTKPHRPYDHAKLLWNNNTAIGFYSYKKQGAALNDNVGLLCTWSIPVLDGLYIRKEHRGRDHGVQVLQDYLAMYPEGPIGVSQPCSKPFLKVCHKYLKKHPEDRSRLWLCTPPGNEDHRVSLWRHSKKVYKQVEKTSIETPTTSVATTSSMSSSSTSSFPSTSLLDTLASVSASRRLEEDAEANPLHVDNVASAGPKGDASCVGGQDNVQSQQQDDVGEGVIVSSASSCQSSCKDEHQSGVRCQGCSKSDHHECTNGHSEANTSFEIKDDAFNADSSEAIANFSEEGKRAEEAYKKTGERGDVELQNIASSSSVLYEGEDAHMSSQEAETTAIDLSSNNSKLDDKPGSHAKNDKTQEDARKREVDSSITSADDDRSVGGGGGHNHFIDGCDNSNQAVEPQIPTGNGDLLKNLLSKPKFISKPNAGAEPVHTSGSSVKIETKPNVNDIMYSSHACQVSKTKQSGTDTVESKPVIKVKDEHGNITLVGQIEFASGSSNPDQPDLEVPVGTQGHDEHMDSAVGNAESGSDCTSVVFSDEHIRQLLTKEECTSPVVPERPTRPHPVQIIHNPLAGEDREAAESQSKEAQSLLPRLLTGYGHQVDNPSAMIAGSDSDSQQSVENVQLPGNHEQNTPSADSMTGRRRPFRVSDYSTWFTNENYNILSRQQQGQKRSSESDSRNNDTGAMTRTWKRNRRTGTLSERERLRHPSWSVWHPVQGEDQIRDPISRDPISRDPISSNQGLSAGDASSRGGVTVRELLQRHRDVPEPTSTLPNVINTSTYTPTSTTYVYSNSLGQQPQQQPQITSQRFLGPPVTSYNAFQSQPDKPTDEPPIGHFHTFRWTRPRKVYARRGTRHPSAPARSSTPDSSFDDIRPAAPFTAVTDDQSSRAEALGQPQQAQTQDKFTSTRGLFNQSSLDNQEVAGSSMTVTESTQSRELNPPPQVTSPNASTSSDGDTRGLGEGNGSLIKQLLLREPGIHAPKPETAYRQSCAHESRVSQSQSMEEEQQRSILREEGEISSHQRGDQEDEDDEDDDMDNKTALRMQLGINVGVSVGAPVNYRNTQTSSYTCEHCDIVFTDSVMYVLHMGCHGRRSAFECNRCGLVCRDKYEFAIHFIQGEHNKD